MTSIYIHIYCGVAWKPQPPRGHDIDHITTSITVRLHSQVGTHTHTLMCHLVGLWEKKQRTTIVFQALLFPSSDETMASAPGGGTGAALQEHNNQLVSCTALGQHMYE